MMPEASPNAPQLPTERQLVDNERLELLDLLLEAAVDGFLDWHLDDGTVHYSPRFRMILGYEDEPLPCTPWAWLELTHAEDRPLVAMELEDLVAGNWPFDLTFRMKHRVVGWRWLRTRAVVHRDSAGNATRLVVVFADVTAQVRAERRQSSLLNAVPDLLIRVQSDSKVVTVKIPEGNALYARGTPPRGELLLDCPFAAKWSDQAAQALATAVTERRSTRFEAHGLVGEGTSDTCDIEIRVFPSSDDEALFVVRDITFEKRQRDQGLQSQKLEAIGQLAAGIAHEINTPLQFVGDNLNFLAEAASALEQALSNYREQMPDHLMPQLKQLDKDLDIDYMTEHLKPAFSAAIDGVQRVSVIVQAMKAFAHPGPKEKRPEDLNHALETTLTLSTNVWKYSAQIVRDFAADLPQVHCVVGEINQVFLNLITNAAHAIAERVGEAGPKGTIRISTRRAGESVEVRIADTGAGIPEQVRSRIFDPFFTTKAVGKGTGQGLPLARAIMVQHGGSLEFETETGLGTTFIMQLPMDDRPT